MRLHLPLAAVWMATALFTAMPASAQSRSEELAAAEKQCQPGREARAAMARAAPLPEGAMPLQLPGATTISPREAQCMMEHMGIGLYVIAAMRTQDKIPGTLVELQQMAGDTDEIRQAYAKAFARFTGGDKDSPMLFYCHHDRCQLSVMAVQRAQDAGYRKLYWLRAGNSGWVNAGLPLEREAQAKAAAARTQEAVRIALMDVVTCGIEVTDADFMAIALKSPTDSALAANLRARAEDSRNTRVNCLQRTRDAVAKLDPQNPAVAEIDALIHRAPDEIDRTYKAARARVEAAPSAHFKAPLDRIALAPLSAALDKARASKSARQTCGTFDRPMPNNQTQVSVVKSALADYRACLDRLEGATRNAATMAAMGHRSSDSDFDAPEALALVSGSARYRCSVRPASGCLPDASWDRVATIATPAHIAAYEKSRKDQSSLLKDIDTLNAEANDWVDRVNAHIDQVEASRSRSSGGGYYSAPSSNAQPVRRAYGSSAAGMK